MSHYLDWQIIKVTKNSVGEALALTGTSYIADGNANWYNPTDGC